MVNEKFVNGYLNALKQSDPEGAEQIKEHFDALKHEVRLLRKQVRQERERSAYLGRFVASIEDAISYLQSEFLPMYKKASQMINDVGVSDD